MAVESYRYVFLAESESTPTVLNLDDVIRLFRTNKKNDVLGIEGLSHFRVSYNTINGSVTFLEPQTANITTIFNKNIKEYYEKNLREAIAIYAKLYLIEKINELAEQKYPGMEGVKKILDKYKISFSSDSTTFVSADIPKALKEICDDLKSKNIFNDAIIATITNLCCVSDATRIYDDLAQHQHSTMSSP